MNNIFKNLSIARILTAAVAVAGMIPATAAEAEGYSLSIAPFVISSYDEIEVPIEFETPDPCEIAALQFDIVMPEKIELVGSPRSNAERLADGHRFYGDLKDYGARVMIISMSQQNIVGTSGAIAYLTVKAKEGSLSEDETVAITLKDIKLTNGDNSSKLVLPDDEIEIGVRPHVAVTAGEESFVMNPGSDHRIAVSMDNAVTVKGIQLDIYMPVGFTVKDNTFYRSSRIAGSADFNKTTKTVEVDGESLSRTRIMVFDMMGELSEVISGTSGEVFSFDIAAPEDFSATEANVKIDGVILSTANTSGTGDISIYGEGCSITIVNGKTAYDKAQAEIAALEKALEDAIAQIAEQAPDVKDDFTGAEISEQIESLRQAVEEAYEGETLAENYDEVMAPATTISEAIEALVADAAEAQKAHDKTVAENEANDKAQSEIEALETALEEALAQIAEQAPDVKDDFTGAEISEQIESLRQAVEEAYEGETLAENYDEVMAPAAEISEAIEALVAAAAEAQKAHDKTVAENAAYDKAQSEIEALETALEDALAQIAEQAPDVKDDFTGAEISEQIESLRQAVEEAYEGETLAENYDEVMAPAAEISEAIEALVADAAEAQKAHDDAEAEAARKARNEAAYNADLETLAALQEKLDDADADIKENYPGAYDSADQKLIQAAIDKARDAIDNAYAAVADSGEYAGSVDSTAIEDMIETWIEKAKASGIVSIDADSIEGVEAVYTLDGVRHTKPVSGKINILVVSGRKMIKAYIK